MNENERQGDEGCSYSILLVSDFFYPQVGGVETHMFCLAQSLLQRGHRVTILTHQYGDRGGVRHLTGGLKVYHIPRLGFYNSTIFPTVFGLFHVLRDIVLREEIQILHAHQAFATMGHECILWARTMGLKVIFTDHSLFGFHDVSSVLMNKLLKFSLADVHAVICVSHTSRENTVLRACVAPSRIYVIPNAIEASIFKPDPSKRPVGRIQIVTVSRLAMRKGTDLLAGVISKVCAQCPDVDFMIAGDGPKKQALDDLVEREGLHDRVRLLGSVPHEKVRDVLAQGHLFLNTSLTEAFCMAVVEAAAAGLFVVATNVGGVPEVLSPNEMALADPTVASLSEALEEGIMRVREGHARDPFEQHESVASCYSWARVAERTETVYRDVLASQRDDSLLARLGRYHKCGLWAGKIFCGVMVVADAYKRLVDVVWQQTDIDASANVW